MASEKAKEYVERIKWPCFLAQDEEAEASEPPLPITAVRIGSAKQIALDAFDAGQAAKEAELKVGRNKVLEIVTGCNSPCAREIEVALNAKFGEGFEIMARDSQPRSPEPIEQTRERFARDEPEAADILRDYEESDEEWAVCASRDWEMYILGAGHPRRTPFKKLGK